MKKLVAVTLAAFAGSFLAVALLGLPIAVRAGGGQPATQNGDTNGDGDLDIADVIYVLVHLFRGGPAPVACADSPELVARVEALEGAVSGLHLEANCTPDRRLPDRFVDNGDGTLIDPCTGLIWSVAVGDLNGDGLLNQSDVTDWDSAFAYCQALELAGHTDWRLPTLREATGLIPCGACEPLGLWWYFSPFRFPSNQAPNCWTDETFIGQGGSAQVWLVYLGADGGSNLAYPTGKTARVHVLAVRGP